MLCFINDNFYIYPHATKTIMFRTCPALENEPSSFCRKALTAVLYIILFFFASVNSNAQDNLGFQWQRTFGGPDQEFATGISKTADGGFVITALANTGSSYDVWI